MASLGEFGNWWIFDGFSWIFTFMFWVLMVVCDDQIDFPFGVWRWLLSINQQTWRYWWDVPLWHRWPIEINELRMNYCSLKLWLLPTLGVWYESPALNPWKSLKIPQSIVSMGDLTWSRSNVRTLVPYIWQFFLVIFPQLCPKKSATSLAGTSNYYCFLSEIVTGHIPPVLDTYLIFPWNLMIFPWNPIKFPWCTSIIFPWFSSGSP